jgi:hypothetical protein
LTGASLTAVTVMLTESLSFFAPPAPVLPWSSVVSVKSAAPLKLAVGVKLRPFNAALTSASVPVKTMLASAVPSPVAKASPPLPASVSVPLVTLKETCAKPLAASTSETLN